MPDLLLELLSEEIPARMQARAAEDLKRLVTAALVERGFLYEGAVAFATPRRLALHVAGLPGTGRDVTETRRGPRVGAPEAALQGFLRSTGLTLDQLSTETDPKKGAFHIAVLRKAGRPTAEVLAEILPEIVRAFPWPKSMRWGAASAMPGSLRWVRPLQSILATFDTEIEAPEIIRFEVGGVASGDATRGHRFLAPAAITARRFDDYVGALQAAKVVLDPARRRDIIRHDARDLAFAQGLEVIEDEALLEEVAGLVEWPVVLIGAFDEAFLEMPPEVIRATIRANQKCFVLRGRDGRLANRFVLVSNIEARDGGAAIVAGNERVVRARLSDAKFFWDTDRRVPLESRLPKLNSIVFHEKLGTQGERVERVAALARELASVTGADPDLAERAARLAKADLTTEMVGEFPELQGLMGRYYAAAQGEDPAVAAAIEDHYRPLGPSDRVPSEPVSVAVALADKLDTLVGFWAIDEKPTGSKDPYALRRAALGVIRLVLENGLRLPLRSVFIFAIDRGLRGVGTPPHGLRDSHAVPNDLLPFFHDRLKIYLRERGARHDLIDAVLNAGEPSLSDGVEGAPASEDAPEIQPPGGAPHRARPSAESVLPTASGGRMGAADSARSNDDLLAVVRRVEALGAFLATADGANLLAGAKRAANILRIEEKKDGRAYDEAVDPALLGEGAERALADALDVAERVATKAVASEDFAGAMTSLATLRPVVDAFFDQVTVNDLDPTRRANRLRLLNRLRRATLAVADFTKIEG